MSEVADKLREARALIERGWTRGEFDNGRTWTKPTCFCALGAIGAAYGLNLNKSPQIERLKHLDATALLKLAVGADEILGTAKKQRSIVDWNDAPERTKNEVLAAFDRAIELAEPA